MKVYKVDKSWSVILREDNGLVIQVELIG